MEWKGRTIAIRPQHIQCENRYKIIVDFKFGKPVSQLTGLKFQSSICVLKISDVCKAKEQTVVMLILAIKMLK